MSLLSQESAMRSRVWVSQAECLLFGLIKRQADNQALVTLR